MKRVLASLFLTTAVVVTAHPALAQSDQDRRFADAMTKHHRDGIEMARMAVEKAVHEELRALARKMIDEEQRDIDEMQSLRGSDPQTPMDVIMKMPGMMPEVEMERDMARLRAATGNAFDIAFTEVMPKHHQGGITMANDEVRDGQLEAMKNVARRIASSQSEERAQMLAMHERYSAEGRTRLLKE